MYSVGSSDSSIEQQVQLHTNQQLGAIKKGNNQSI